MRRPSLTEIVIVVYVLLLIYVLLSSRGGGTVGMRAWYMVWQACRRTALIAGKAGISAEKAYYVAAQTARGGM